MTSFSAATYCWIYVIWLEFNNHRLLRFSYSLRRCNVSTSTQWAHLQGQLHHNEPHRALLGSLLLRVWSLENYNDGTEVFLLILPHKTPPPILYRTQDGEHHAILQHFHGARTDEEDGLERVALTEEVLSGSAEGRLDVQRQGTQAATAGRGEQRQLQDLLVKVHGDVGSQLVREVLQQLWRWCQGEIQRVRQMKRTRGRRGSCENTTTLLLREEISGFGRLSCDR